MKTNSPLYSCFLAGLFAFASLTHHSEAQDALRLQPGTTQVASVEGIIEYAMPNGLRVLLFPDPSRPIITVNITYKVGSRHEDYGEKGMAHLLEHLVFKGTPTHPNIPEELTKHGARANGTTWFDRTNYYETFDSTEENLRWALGLESDRMVNSFIARKDLETEFSVVRNEYESGENNPANVLNKRMLATVFQWHNYGRDTIGEKSDIEGAPIERLQAFYRKHYQPDNAVLLVAGHLDPQKTLDQVKAFHKGIYGADHATAAVVGDFAAAEIEKILRESFGDWSSPVKYERIPEDYQPVAARTETIPTPDKANAVYRAGYGFAMRDDDPEYPALTVGGYIVGGGFLNSRLATRIRQKEGISYGVGGRFSASPLDKDGNFTASAIYNPENVTKLETAFREEIERAAKSGFTEEELVAAKSGWLQSRKVQRSSDSTLAQSLSSYLHYGRNFQWDEQREEAVRNLTVSQVNNVIGKRLDYSKMIIVKAGDFKKSAAP
ncbi:MAG: insulinase family protein [Pedosphaera sp.]|nr:insulinase family protein [Pedosphaera sp.]